MIRELVLERLEPGRERRALGTLGPSHDVCPRRLPLAAAAWLTVADPSGDNRRHSAVLLHP